MGQKGDFLQVLRERGYAFDDLRPLLNGSGLSGNITNTEVTTGTTVFAMKYRAGVLPWWQHGRSLSAGGW